MLSGTHAFLKTCVQKGITLNPDKFKFCRREVEFVGYHIGWEAYYPTEEKLAALSNFSMPEKPTITDIRRWFGFVNQLMSNALRHVCSVWCQLINGTK